MHVVLLPHSKVRCINQHGNLHDFRHLKIKQAERNPAAGTVCRFSDTRNEYRTEQEESEQEEWERHLLPGFHRNMPNNVGAEQRYHQRNHMTDKKVALTDVILRRVS